MANLTTNNVAATLNIYAQEALDQFIATMPSFNLFNKLFDSEIANGGQALITRIPNTYFNSVNDLTQGWSDISASVSNITISLQIGNYSEIFDELQFATLTDANIRNWFMPQMAQQLANGIVVNAINNVNTSSYGNYISVNSSSLFSITGSTSLASASAALDNLEIPQEGRYAIVTPTINQALMAGQIYNVYDAENSKGALQRNSVKELAGFQLSRYARFSGATAPQGGAKVSGQGGLVGICGNAQGIVAAVRQPVEINYGTTWSANAVDKSSGLSLQVRLMYDQSKPVWRLAVVSVYGTAQGNTSAIIPIVTKSN